MFSDDSLDKFWILSMSVLMIHNSPGLGSALFFTLLFIGTAIATGQVLKAIA